jgi:hypothetical protein
MNPLVPKETDMHYKTIVLEILQQYPERYDQARRSRTVLSTLDCFARQLKTSHEAWKNHLSQAKPDSDPSQIASEALEIALKELEDSLHSGISPEAKESLSLEGARTFIGGRTSPG